MEQKDRLIDSYSPYEREVAHLRPLDDSIPEFAWRVLAGYRPKLPDGQWRAVRFFVVTVALTMRPRTFDNARRLMTMVSRFTAWAWAATGRELSVASIFTDELISRFVAVCLGEHSQAHRWGVTRQLATIAEQLANTSIKRLRPAGPSQRMVPYSDAEVATMHSWAATLSTPFKRRNAWAILGLAGGAGLSSAELIDVRAEDVRSVNQRTVVTVRGDRPRQVPVRTAWTSCLSRSIDDRLSGPLFRGYRLDEYPPRVLQTFLTDNKGEIRPSPQRLHYGWVVAQIDAGLPLPVLLSITGYKSPAALRPYLRHARQHSVADYTSLIVGEVTR